MKRITVKTTKDATERALLPTPMIRLSSEQLFNGNRELIIEHCGEEYRLRWTSKGKLILTK